MVKSDYIFRAYRCLLSWRCSTSSFILSFEGLLLLKVHVDREHEKVESNEKKKNVQELTSSELFDLSLFLDFLSRPFEFPLPPPLPPSFDLSWLNLLSIGDLPLCWLWESSVLLLSTLGWSSVALKSNLSSVGSGPSLALPMPNIFGSRPPSASRGAVLGFKSSLGLSPAGGGCCGESVGVFWTSPCCLCRYPLFEFRSRSSFGLRSPRSR